MNLNIRLGITGLRRTGKTVFLTSLIYQLSELGSRHLDCFDSQGVSLRPAMDGAPKDRLGEPFPYSRYLQGLRENPPCWPPPTVQEFGSTLRFYYEVPGMKGTWDRVRRCVGRARSFGTVTLHIHDYPGEYLLDVGMKEKTYQHWSREAIDRMHAQLPGEARRYESIAADLQGQASVEIAEALHTAYSRYVLAARDAGMELIQPAMTLLKWHHRRETDPQSPELPLPDELPFVPLPACLDGEEVLWKDMAARYQDHVKQHVNPFLARIRGCNAQLVLVDVLRVLRNGVDVFNDTSRCIAEILAAYHRKDWWPSGIKCILFAATKADHAAKNYRSNMTRLLGDVVQKAQGAVRGNVAIANPEYFSSLRATKDATAQLDGMPVEVLEGLRRGENTQGAYCPGVVPQEWPEDWSANEQRHQFPEWEPRTFPKKNGTRLPHINLDKVIWKLFASYF